MSNSRVLTKSKSDSELILNSLFKKNKMEFIKFQEEKVKKMAEDVLEMDEAISQISHSSPEEGIVPLDDEDIRCSL